MKDQETIDMLKQIIELNQMIAKQNALIVQALTLPQLLVKNANS